jgi:hypothetical protein
MALVCPNTPVLGSSLLGLDSVAMDLSPRIRPLLDFFSLPRPAVGVLDDWSRKADFGRQLVHSLSAYAQHLDYLGQSSEGVHGFDGT